MSMTNPPALPFELVTNTVVGRIYSHFAHHESSTATRILLIIVLAVLVHVLVKIVRHISEWFINKSQAQKTPLDFVTQQPKFITLTRLIVSGVIFVIYFSALGLVLQEFGVDMKIYLGSATVIGLAISFGSQGLVQDVVIGLTLIFSDVMDVGDMVEIAGTVVVVGRVEEIGLRFTTLRNFYNQIMFIPNRTIANVSRFPHGGVFAYADIQLPQGADREKAAAWSRTLPRDVATIRRDYFERAGHRPGGNGAGRRLGFSARSLQNLAGPGSLIETTFRQQMVSAMKNLDPNYADWQVPVTYRAMTATKKL